ncbi:hypothetical protein S7335_3916 [Synechococcus sp. PCC 7335]|nr:hypothetical protein S7335_3916 [Synechococcus sp. PCC 7335]
MPHEEKKTGKKLCPMSAMVSLQTASPTVRFINEYYES